MWVWALWRWMLGTVTFRAEGGLCERFLRKLFEHDASFELWNVSREDHALTATCRVSDYRRMRPFARQTGTRVKAISKNGLPFLLKPLEKRSGLAVGAVTVLILYMLLSTHIWVVDIRVEDEALADKIALHLAENGVCVGKRMNDADIATIRMNAIAAIKEIHQLSLYFDGSIAHVDVQLQEDSATPPDSSPANVIASCDGLILSIRATSGDAVVKVGEAVVKGDLLVCGAVETDKGYLLRHASAVVMAQTHYTLQESVCLSELLPQSGKVIEQPTLCLFSLKFPFYTPATFDDTWTATTQTRSAKLFGVTLPIGVTSEVYTHQTMQQMTYTCEEAEQLARERLSLREAETFAECEILSAEYNGVWDGDTYRLTAEYVCKEDIAEQTPLLIASGMSE